MIELSKIQSVLNAPKGQFNSFGGYKYRSCEDILAALKPLLAVNNCILTITDQIRELSGRFYVGATVTLWRVGESPDTGISVTAWAREAEHKKGMDESQITGACSSYARKYALNGMFAIDDTKDADAQPPQNEQKPAKVDVKPVEPPKPQAKEQTAYINNLQAKRMFAICRKNGWELPEIKSTLIDMGITSSKLIPANGYDAIMEVFAIKKEKKDGN